MHTETATVIKAKLKGSPYNQILRGSWGTASSSPHPHSPFWRMQQNNTAVLSLWNTSKRLALRQLTCVSQEAGIFFGLSPSCLLLSLPFTTLSCCRGRFRLAEAKNARYYRTFAAGLSGVHPGWGLYVCVIKLSSDFDASQPSGGRGE